MSVVKYGRLMIRSWIDKGSYHGADRCPEYGAKIKPNMKLIALILKDLVDASRVMKTLTFPHFVTCARCKKLLPIKSEITIVGLKRRERLNTRAPAASQDFDSERATTAR